MALLLLILKICLRAYAGSSDYHKMINNQPSQKSISTQYIM